VLALNLQIKNIINEKRAVQNELFKHQEAVVKEEEALAKLHNLHMDLVDQKSDVIAKISEKKDNIQLLNEKKARLDVELSKKRAELNVLSSSLSDKTDKLNNNIKLRSELLDRMHGSAITINAYNQKLNEL